MSSTTLLVKNMVCPRCILAVENMLKNEVFPFHKVSIGEIQLMIAPSQNQKEQLRVKLNAIGFEIIDDNTGRIIEKIKNLVINRARNEAGDRGNKIKLSAYLSENVHYEYTYLSSLFSAVEGRTIQDYYIVQRIEKVKELLIYGQMTLSQIAFELDYSSESHLSKQFKKVTDTTPSLFKNLGGARRKSIDTL